MAAFQMQNAPNANLYDEENNPDSKYNNEIIAYYDECQIDYEIVWHLKSHMAMHYGYFYPETRRLRDALQNLNIELANFGGITKRMKILDAGCGVGGSSIFLAKNFDAEITGITISEKQVQSATENAKKYGVANLCDFQNQDYLQTNFDDNTFDCVWAIESSCYAPDKIDFLNEVYRILKPGGKLIVADFFNNDNIEGIQNVPLMKKWVKTWSIQAYAGIREFSNKISKAGFVGLNERNVTSNVLKSIKRLYYASFIGLPVTYIGQLLGIRNKRQTLNTWSSYYQYKAYKKNLWQYMFYTATKPHY